MNILYIGFPARGHTNGVMGLLQKLNINNRVTCISSTSYAKDYLSNNLEFIPLEFLDTKVNMVDFTRDYFLGFEFLIDNLDTALKELENKVSYSDYDIIIHDSLALYGAVFAKKYKIPACSAITNYAFFKENIHYTFILQDFFKHQLRRFPKALMVQIKYFLLAKKYSLSSYNIINMLLLQGDLNFIFLPEKFYPIKNKNKLIFLNNNLRYQEHNFIGESQRDTIFISLGTVLPNDKLLRNLFHLFNNTLHKVLLLTQNDKLTEELKGYNSKNIEILTSCNQLEVLKRSKIAIYHGGSNTASECLVNGIYHILFPQQVEQRHNAMNLEKLGLAYIPRENKVESIMPVIDNLEKNKAIMKNLKFMKELANKGIDIGEIETQLNFLCNNK